MTPDVLDVKGAAALLGIGRNAVYDAVSRGELPHRRIGKHIRFSRAALLRWLAGGDVETLDPCSLQVATKGNTP